MRRVGFIYLILLQVLLISSSKIKYKNTDSSLNQLHFKSNHIEISLLKNEYFQQKKVSVGVVRFDKINDLISGNKLFKLSEYIQLAQKENKTGIITKGGPYSNHLAATAHYTHLIGLKSMGLVRGEKPSNLSHTLQQCQQDKMELIYLSRTDYDSIQNSEDLAPYITDYASFCFIPEGGQGARGAIGASGMYECIGPFNPTHIVVPVGTATTLSGVLWASDNHIQIIGVSVLKGFTDIKERMLSMLPESHSSLDRMTIWEEYHFGGYAKKNTELLEFMNLFYKDFSIPTDFVYTGKMMFAVFDKIKTNYFPEGSRIACIHTGGLQGNLSLSVDDLCFI